MFQIIAAICHDIARTFLLSLLLWAGTIADAPIFCQVCMADTSSEETDTKHDNVESRKYSNEAKANNPRSADEKIREPLVVFRTGLDSLRLTPETLVKNSGDYDLIVVASFKSVQTAPSSTPHFGWLAILQVTEVLKGNAGRMKYFGIRVHSPTMTWQENFDGLAGRKCIYGFKTAQNEPISARLLLKPYQCGENQVSIVRCGLGRPPTE